MWNWAWSLFAKRDDRELFAYWDGHKQRRIDPLVAWRELWADPDIDLGRVIQVAMNPQKGDGTPFYPDADVADAEAQLLSLIRKVFGVKEWREDVPGLTINETMDLFGQYMTYRTEIKKKRSTSPTPSPLLDSTEELDSADSTLPESQPTTEPDCGCTGTASSDAAPSGQEKLSAAL